MGYLNGQYYEKFVAHTSNYSNKISDLQKTTNKIDINETKELIDMIQEQFMKEMRDVTKVHLNSRNYDIKEKKEPVEYVVEETKDEEER